MALNNNAKIIRREILTRISSILVRNKGLGNMDRIALEMRPKNGKHVRCCVYHDRAVLKYKIMAMMGFEESSEEDELKSLSQYYRESRDGEKTDSQILNVVHAACSSCQKNNYVVTNMCQGCVGRSCIVNCPKGAISEVDGKAKIDKDKCVNCGICQQVCPFHAIIYAPVPCEDVCPVGAISKGPDGKEKIDMEKCILCGKCMEACPYGAVVEKTHLFDVIEEINGNEKVIAMVAPSIAGQFRNETGKILSSLYRLGFDEVVEVASGADITSKNEAEEFMEHLEDNSPMTTSCCPAFVNMVNIHCPEHADKLSQALSPMEYTAMELRAKYPGARLVFIGPCVAKKSEAENSQNVDYVLNYEEFGSWLVASGIEISDCDNRLADTGISAEGRYFAVAGGVSRAVAARLPDTDFSTLCIDGIDRSFLKKLKPVLNSNTATLVEVMSCENGCIGGCSSLSAPKAAQRQLKKFIETEVKQEEALLAGTQVNS